MSKSASFVLAVALLSTTMTALASASGIRPPQKKQEQQRRQLQVGGAEASSHVASLSMVVCHHRECYMV